MKASGAMRDPASRCAPVISDAPDDAVACGKRLGRKVRVSEDVFQPENVLNAVEAAARRSESSVPGAYFPASSLSFVG
jgi:hypothetical protein